MTDFGSNWHRPPLPQLGSSQPLSIFYVSEVELETFVPESEEELNLWWYMQKAVLESGNVDGVQASGTAAASVIRRRRLIQRMGAVKR